MNLEWFLKGIIQGFFKRGETIEEFEKIEPYVTGLRFNFAMLPDLKDIKESTIEPISSEREKILPTALKMKVLEKQKEGLMTIVRRIYKEVEDTTKYKRRFIKEVKIGI